MRRTPRALLSGAAAAVLGLTLLAACGQSGSDGDDASGGGNFPVTVKAGNGSVKLDSKPDTIVSLSPTATEMLFAIGADEQVVAVDDQSTYPKDAPRTKLSGLTPNVDAIANYKPDLVIVSDDLNGVVKNLKKLDVPVLVEPAAADLEETYDQISDLGKATGNTEAAENLVAKMKSEIADAVEDAGEPKKDITYYHEVDSTYYTVTSKTFAGQIYGLFGLKNIADAGGVDAGGGYPQLSAEAIVAANPNLIFLADTKCCGQNAETVGKRPGWENIDAVKNKQVVGLDDDVASRWGPRVVDYVESVAEAVKKANTGS